MQVLGAELSLEFRVVFEVLAIEGEYLLPERQVVRAPPELLALLFVVEAPCVPEFVGDVCDGVQHANVFSE